MVVILTFLNCIIEDFILLGGLFFNINGKYYLRGISSVTITGADQICDPTASVAFTDISFFLPWISNNLRHDRRVNNRFGFA